MKLTAFRIFLFVTMLIFALWVILYFCTTRISDKHGSGGLSGAIDKRVFASERHLIMFYPVFFVERLLRNGSVENAHYFNCEIADGVYRNQWLYGDVR